MTGVEEVAELIYRADWTELSLSATVVSESHPDARMAVIRERLPERARAGYHPATLGVRRDEHRLVVIPGGRYRCDTGESGDTGDTPEECPAALPLLRPAWLLTGHTLELNGRVTAAGREAYSLIATPRKAMSQYDQVAVLVDAELGILLRRGEIAAGRTLDLVEMTALTLGAAGVDERDEFMSPSSDTDDTDDIFGGPGWEHAKAVAGLAAGGLGALLKVSPARGRATAHDAEPQMPNDDPAPVLTDDRVRLPAGLPYLLYRSGTAFARLGAVLYHWVDADAETAQVPAGARRAGYGGVGFLLDTIRDKVETTHHAARVRTEPDGRYRIDYTLRPDDRRPSAVAGDAGHS